MYRVDKDLNKFIFLGEISNLRNNPWNKERVYQWLKESGGKLSKDEKSLLRELKEILSDYNFDLIQAYFLIYERSKLLDILSKEIGIVKINRFKEIFESFTRRFNLLWEKEKLHLEKIEKHLNFRLRKIEPALATISNLVGAKKIISIRKIPTHLAISSKENKDQVGWFSILDNKIDLVLECSGVSERNYTFLDLIILHEYFHLALRGDDKTRNMIKKFSVKERILGSLSKDMTPEQILEELLISSFVPEGYLALNYLNGKIKPVNSIIKKGGIVSFVSVRQFCAYKLRKVAKEYVDTKKSIDEKYLSSLISVIKNR